MSPEVPRQLRGVRPPREILESAIGRVGERISELYPLLASGGAERADGYLQSLRAKLSEVMEGEAPEPIRERLSASPLFDPLMEALGQELIRGPSDPDEAAVVLAVLRAWASLREAPTAPSTEAEEDDPEDLRARMRGPGAYELLIEVAHDFRSPLASILFLAEALRDGHSGPVTDVQRSQLGLVYSAAFAGFNNSTIRDLCSGAR